MRVVIALLLLILPGAGRCPAASGLPEGNAPAALAAPHFPDRLHAFVWRNWNFAETERLAATLGTSVENVAAVAASMGLPEGRAVSPEIRRRGYITLVRRNWHLLPYEQLLTLLGMSEAELAHALREDDFLFAKLGQLKPRCGPLRYAPPTEEAKRRAAEIRAIVREAFGEVVEGEKRPPSHDGGYIPPSHDGGYIPPSHDGGYRAEERFAFVRQLSEVEAVARPLATVRTDEGLRFIYSYFALYGDPLMNPELEPYPDGLLERLAALGVNGVWLHTVLRDLAPSARFPEFGRNSEVRLANLRRLVERAKRYGIGIYLYVNEPRAMPAAFFEGRPQLAGVREGEYVALCTSAPEVRAWLSEALAHVFQQTPDLAGVFTITASENLTNCASHGRSRDCPRCKGRTPAEIIAEVNAAVEAGVHRANPQARVLAWDWGWADEWAGAAIERLPKSAWLMSVSEWSKPIERGGVATTVGEYSISAVGPGPRATEHWRLAKAAGLKTVAKVQLNNTWEISSVPYLPVLDLVAEHRANLASAGVDGLMLSWTLGGYPSPNLEIARRLSRAGVSKEAALEGVARERYGAEGAPHARRAWTAFSAAFREYPYNGSVVYNCPVQMGPANPLYLEPTGYRATMTGIPYDDLDRWRGPYPAEVFAGQFEKLAEGWREGLVELEQAVEKAPAAKRAEARRDLGVARAARLHFRSVANQARFVMAREALAARERPLAAEDRRARREAMRRIAREEEAAARELFALAQADSRLGFEAANQYFYLPNDLAEKVINCRYVEAQLGREDEAIAR